MRAVLQSWLELSPEVRHFEFAVPEVDSLPFKPGQFVSFTQEIGGKKITRPYSICSPPDGNRFSLCLNLVPEGFFSPFLFAMKEGDSLEMRPPLGAFTIRDPGRDMIWVATGTGIAPFRSMWLHGGIKGNVTLILGARYQPNLLYSNEWIGAALDFRPTLSRPGEQWTGRTGHVQPHVLEAIGERRDLDIYICGLKAMVDDLRELLKQRGFDRKQIVSEKYD